MRVLQNNLWINVFWYDVDLLLSLFAEILSKEVNCTEIQFMEDGSWRAMKPDSDEYCIPDSPSAKTADTTAAPSQSSSSVAGKFS